MRWASNKMSISRRDGLHTYILAYLWSSREKKLNETRHGHTHKGETDKSRARRAEYKGQRRRLTHQWRCKMLDVNRGASGTWGLPRVLETAIQNRQNKREREKF